jgi:hypothetical protein
MSERLSPITKDANNQEPPKKPKIWFNGCRMQSGHFLHGPKSDALDYTTIGHTLGKWPDGGFAPCDRLTGGYEVEHKAMITWTKGYTVVAFWDRSIDRRHASNSCFIADQILSFSEMIPFCEEAFPEVFKRYGAGLDYINGKTLEEHIKDGDYSDPYKQT